MELHNDDVAWRGEDAGRAFRNTPHPKPPPISRTEPRPLKGSGRREGGSNRRVTRPEGAMEERVEGREAGQIEDQAPSQPSPLPLVCSARIPEE